MTPEEKRKSDTVLARLSRPPTGPFPKPPAPAQAAEPERKYVCHAGRDGECNWQLCPQRYDRKKHCPIDVLDDEDQPIEQPLPAPAQAADPSLPINACGDFAPGETDRQSAVRHYKRAEKAEARIAELEEQWTQTRLGKGAAEIELAKLQGSVAELEARLKSEEAMWRRRQENWRTSSEATVARLLARVAEAVKILEPMDHAGPFVVRALEVLRGK